MLSDPSFAPDMKFAPYWWEAAPPLSLPEAAVPAKADVAIVGAGYTGLVAALSLARAGRDVVVCEAEAIGWGASSRNQGQMGALFKRSFEDLAAAFGRDRAAAIFREGQLAVEHCKDLIETEQIQCHLQRSGRFVAAYRPRDYESLARELDVLRREVDYEADMVPRSEQHREIGTGFYFGGQVRHNDAMLHGALYHRGLLERALDAGVQVLPHTPVTHLERVGTGFAVATGRGAIQADDVLIATNGYTREVTPDLRRRVIPIGAYGIATEPLPPSRINRILPAGRPYNDTRKLIQSIRPSPDGSRLIFGGRAALSEADPRSTARRLQAVMVDVFPDLSDVRITHSWMGFVAFTFQFLPHIGTRDGAHYALGCCGSGIAMATWLGRKAALRILGSKDAATAFDDIPFETRPLYHGNPWFLPLILSYYRLRDRLPR